MAEHENEDEVKLRKLAARLELGWQKLYPVRKKDLEVVRQAVQEQWDQEKELAREAAEARLARKAESARKEASLEQEPEQEREQESGEEQTQVPPEQPKRRSPGRHR